MQEREKELAGGSLYYKISDGKAEITRFQGLASELVIPDMLEGYPVAVLGKKAFLSRKNLRRISLPETIEEVGDWCLAHCDSLTDVCVPEKKIRFGRSVFLKCGNLKRIGLRRSADNGEFQPELLAAAVRDFEAYYLMDIPSVGSSEWLEKWDVRLETALYAADTEGYSKQVLCGEEDYGSTDLGAYISGKRKGKVRLALLRLLFPTGLSYPLREKLERYLLAHTKNQESEETWRVILEEHGEDRAYYRLFAELGCLNAENMDGILEDIGENFPEMKAFFLRYGGDKVGGGDFFSELEL